MTTVPPPIRDGLFTVEDGTVRLIVGSCARCGSPHFPRTDCCPYCGGPVAEDRLGPDAAVVLCTVVRRAPPGYAGPVPYGFGVIRLTGTRLEIVSRIAAADLGAVRPGDPGRLAVEEVPGPDGEPTRVWTLEVRRS